MSDPANAQELDPRPHTKWEATLHGILKLLSYVIVLLMALAILYAAYTSVRYWTGIGV